MKKKRKENKLDLILNLEKKQLKEQRKIENLERKQLNKVNDIDVDEKNVSLLEKKQLRELDDLKNLEIKIKDKLGGHPLRKISYKDIGKAMIGAFVGIISHFAVLEGITFAGTISLARANFFLMISFLIGLIMIYYTGFRKVSDPRLFAFLPLRLILVYAVTIFAILIALYIFNSGHFVYNLVYRQVAVLSLPAIIGACAADLIGGE